MNKSYDENIHICFTLSAISCYVYDHSTIMLASLYDMVQFLCRLREFRMERSK